MLPTIKILVIKPTWIWACDTKATLPMYKIGYEGFPELLYPTYSYTSQNIAIPSSDQQPYDLFQVLI